MQLTGDNTERQPGLRLLELVAVMDRLRRECPWDREQTHRSLARYLLEETYETLEAIESGDSVHLREELGDLLLQVVFHARLAAESDADEGGFDIDDVAGGIVDKLVHRHPHVFARSDDSGALSSGEVAANWESIKAAEKSRTSALDGVPMTMPALALADKVLAKAAEVGADPVVEVRAESDPVVEVRAERASKPPPPPLGTRLLALVAEARESGIDAEQELRVAVRLVVARIRAAEATQRDARP